MSLFNFLAISSHTLFNFFRLSGFIEQLKIHTTLKKRFFISVVTLLVINTNEVVQLFLY